MATSQGAIRKCVHCGFCTATCPTYVLLGDELDSPRGRIYLIKDMLENARQPTPQVVKHIDRCLSCLACVTTCPSDVDYMHLVDHARAYIQERYERPWHERFARSVLASVLPHQNRFRMAAGLGNLFRPLAPLLDKARWSRPFAAMLRLAPRGLPSAAPETTPEVAQSKGRVAILQGCAEPVLRPETRAATMRFLARAGYQPVLASGEGCCGALVHHMGREDAAREAARRNVDAWHAEIAEGGLEAILITASGCGTMVKDYGFLLRDDAEYAEKAAQVSALARDVSEFLADIELPDAVPMPEIKVAYHAACSLQHGQKVTREPVRLLEEAGFTVLTPAEGHLCCGSAGTYNILQPEIATTLRDRKVANIARLQPDVIAAGNVGCATQIASGTAIPVVHTVELLDWATGGPRPAALANLECDSTI
nr:glycolate oxidase subunit GlcF [Aurantiacibacter rhizosphaerae]